jgi:hypothetical protein
MFEGQELSHSTTHISTLRNISVPETQPDQQLVDYPRYITRIEIFLQGGT